MVVISNTVGLESLKEQISMLNAWTDDDFSNFDMLTMT